MALLAKKPVTNTLQVIAKRVSSLYTPLAVIKVSL